MIDLAKEIALAKLYAENPSYVSLQIALANAQAIKETDKLIFTPDGVFPNLVNKIDLPLIRKVDLMIAGRFTI